MTTLSGDFRVSRVDGDREVILSVYGEVDLSTAPHLLDAVGAALDGQGMVVLDLAGVTFIDSQGIRALLHAYQASRSHRVDGMVIRSPRRQARKVLEMTGLSERLTIED
jgi:anti-sigma B factor antagonist